MKRKSFIAHLDAIHEDLFTKVDQARGSLLPSPILLQNFHTSQKPLDREWEIQGGKSHYDISYISSLLNY